MSTDNESAEPRRIRTSDAERERVAAILRNAVAEGRLSLEEGDERLAALYQVKFRDELGVLTVDLPGEEPPAGAGRRGRRGGPAGDWAGPGWGGPAGPGQAGQAPGGPVTDETGPSAGGPGRGPWGHHHRHGHPFRRLAFLALLIFAIVTLSGGHFFWPIIPIAFVTLAVVRCGLFAMWRRPRGQGTR